MNVATKSDTIAGILRPIINVILNMSSLKCRASGCSSNGTTAICIDHSLAKAVLRDSTRAGMGRTKPPYVLNWQGNCSTHPLISKCLIHNGSFGSYAAVQQRRRFRCSVEDKY